MNTISNEKRDVIFLRGCPGSGKSTWAKQYIKENPNTKRVCRDDIRQQLDFYTTNKDFHCEKLVSEIEISNILTLLQKGHDVIVDVTLTNTFFISKYFDSLFNTGLNLNFSYKSFEIDVDEAIKRVNQRALDGGLFVDAKIIRSMHSNFMGSREKFDLIFNEKVKEYHLNYILKNKYHPDRIHDNLLPCVISDIDGTVADMKDYRFPFDWDKVDLDDVKENVVDYIDYIQQIKKLPVFFLSGREEQARSKTLEWLENKAGISHNGLFMRKDKDNRNDWIVKYELLEKHIIGNGYYPILILDDRNRVVNLWRHLGIECWQVQDGNF